MRKKLDENEIILQKWPPIFRDGLRFTDHDLGIMDVMIQGEAEITPKDLKKMRKFGYIFDGIYVSAYIDKSLKGNVNIQDEDDVSPFLMTMVALRRYQAPPLESGGKSDIEALITEPLHAEFEAMRRDEACSSCNVNTGEDEDDAGGR